MTREVQYPRRARKDAGTQVIFQLDIVPRPDLTHPRRRTIKLGQPRARRHHHASPRD